MPGAGVEPACLSARNFKSLASTDSAIRAAVAQVGATTRLRQLSAHRAFAARARAEIRSVWRRESESNRRTRLCRAKMHPSPAMTYDAIPNETASCDFE